jgi:hypothetical protein
MSLILMEVDVAESRVRFLYLATNVRAIHDSRPSSGPTALAESNLQAFPFS